MELPGYYQIQNNAIVFNDLLGTGDGVPGKLC